ncbi:MAG: hypothetical protein CMH83_11945 [Nocardioides sp.]|nr:hypothetical protein [Nocardioides sp.]
MSSTDEHTSSGDVMGDSEQDVADDRRPVVPGSADADDDRPWYRQIPLATVIGVPLAVGILVGSVVGFFTEQEQTASSSVVLGTRPTSQYSGERLELISDMQTTLGLAPVVDEVAQTHDLDPDVLEAAVSLDRIEASSFARLTYTANAPEADRREVLADLVAAMQDYLTPPSPSPALEEAQQDEKAATDAYYEALRTNGGISPEVTLEDLQGRLQAAVTSGNAAQVQRLRRQVLAQVNEARKFSLLEADRTRAQDVLSSVSQNQATSDGVDARALTTSYLDGDTSQSSLTSSAPLRRGAAAGVATALVMAGFILAFARGKRRRPAPQVERRSYPGT